MYAILFITNDYKRGGKTASDKFNAQKIYKNLVSSSLNYCYDNYLYLYIIITTTTLFNVDLILLNDLFS
jgi:hypothetical protein